MQEGNWFVGEEVPNAFPTDSLERVQGDQLDNREGEEGLLGKRALLCIENKSLCSCSSSTSLLHGLKFFAVGGKNKQTNIIGTIRKTRDKLFQLVTNLGFKKALKCS